MKRFYVVLLFVNGKALFSRNVSQIPKVCSAFCIASNSKDWAQAEAYGNMQTNTEIRFWGLYYTTWIWDFIFMVIYGHIPQNGHKTNSLYKEF